jgi:hypothetical protein
MQVVRLCRKGKAVAQCKGRGREVGRQGGREAPYRRDTTESEIQMEVNSRNLLTFHLCLQLGVYF